MKKHKGQIDEHAVDQLLHNLETKKEISPVNGCVISLTYIFSEKAMTPVPDAGIKLINEIEFCYQLSGDSFVRMNG
ncbi:hypothetical protein ACQKP0_20555 [Heyndrickxia sp. NPDC080065]|uniref:hypothetical protein n=1 Tax=Heyndrickxia sp. NPDC080065 TaxID=3390568 RepID=UPI003D005F68